MESEKKTSEGITVEAPTSDISNIMECPVCYETMLPPVINMESEKKTSEGLTLKASNSDMANIMQCPVCYETMLSPVILCQDGHSVCSGCLPNLKSCPVCRGVLCKVRNRLAEDILERCLILCKYKDAGCDVILPGNCLLDHQRTCKYRPIFCRECDKEIPYNIYLQHLRDVEKLETQRASECSTGFEIEEDELTRPGDERFSVWEPTWIHAHDQDFFCFLETSNQHWWVWVGGYADPRICSQFVCSITIWNKEKQTEVKYVGKVHSIRSSPDEVFSTGECLILLDVNLKNLIYKGGIDVLVRIDCAYEAPKTRRGVDVESPINLFGSKSPTQQKEFMANRGNRVNVSRNNNSRSISALTTNDNDFPSLNFSDEEGFELLDEADMDLSDLFPDETFL